MDHGTFKGPIAHLRGKGALLRPSPAGPHCVLAQFDDTELTLEPFVCRDQNRLGFGWHTFKAADFDADPVAEPDDEPMVRVGERMLPLSDVERWSS